MEAIKGKEMSIKLMRNGHIINKETKHFLILKIFKI